jgi:hypothetical protein
MAKKPKSVTLTDAEKEVIQQNIERLKEQRIKSYPDLLDFVEKNVKNPYFHQDARVSPYEAAAPYYGDQMEGQYAAAAEYAQNLANTESPKVTIDPSFYSRFQEKVPVRVGGYSPAYHKEYGTILMPTPELHRRDLIEVGKNQEALTQNNFSPTALSEDEVNKNLLRYWKDTLEHESVHAVDKKVSFNTKGDFSLLSQWALADKYGHMAGDSHIPVGLSKIQREWYSMTGKRFETPDDFKNFIFSLSSSKDPEESMSGFSEEAKRALRVQVQNAKEILSEEVQNNYLDRFDAMEQQKKNELRKNQKKSENIFFLEKSAQLIPALVEYRQASLPTA